MLVRTPTFLLTLVATIKDRSRLFSLLVAVSMGIPLSVGVLAKPSALAQIKTAGTTSVVLSPAGLTFFDQTIGSTSPSESVSLTNNGTTPLHIAKVVVSAPFTVQSGCGTTLVVGGSCNITVHFRPKELALDKGTLTVTSGDAGSPHVIPLQGKGVASAVNAIPSSLDFGGEALNATSGRASVTLANTSGVQVSISSIVANGDFAQTNNCGKSILPSLASACRIDITFTPTAGGTRTGSIVVTNSASGSPHVIPLRGVGGVSDLDFTPTSLHFGSVLLGGKSAPSTILLTNNGSTPVNFISILGSGDYQESNNCGSSLAAGRTCQLSVVFTPSGSGTRNGRITISDTDPATLQTVALAGVGKVPVSTVTVSPRAGSVTPDQVVKFSAAVSGVPSKDVSWAVDGIPGGSAAVGTIDTSGMYTPPKSSGRHTIQATSNADTSQTAVSFAYVTNYGGTYTYHNDNMRTGQNLNETVLSPGNVNSAQFGKIFSFPVDGKIYAQPLYVSHVIMKGKVHNVVYVVTEHDSVYAFDADNVQSQPLWKASFINAAAGITTLTIGDSGIVDITCDSMSPEVGVTGTPVIDRPNNTIYLVARTKEVSGSTTTFVQRLHALDITNGNERPHSPVTIQAKAPGNGVGSDGQGNVLFDPLTNNQRPGLLLLNGTVYITWASFCDPRSYHGWVMGYDAKSLQQLTVFTTTPNGSRGGIWASGAAPAADLNGNIYFATGNGTFDGNLGGTDYSQSILKLATGGGSLNLVDYFAPFNAYFINPPDLDLGAGGVTLIPDQPIAPTHLLVGGGKQGTVYLLDRDNMGQSNSSNDNQIVSSLIHAVGGASAGDHGIWPKGAYWQHQIYYVGTGDVPKAYRLYNGQLSTSPVSQAVPFFGYPGGLPAISSEQARNGIVWVVWEGTVQHAGAVLYAFDAADLSVRLYASTGVGTGRGIQFGIPTVANGKVYVGTASELDVFGLLP